MKKQPIELKPGLRIGVGAGRLILSHKTIDPDGLERWAINYHLTLDGPIRDAFYLSASVLRYIAKVEVLERDLKSSKEYSRRMKIRKEELEVQLAKSENLRDVAQKTNKQRIDKLEGDVLDLKHTLQDKHQLLLETGIKLETVNADFQASEFMADELEKSRKYQKSWSFGLFALALMFLGLWLSALYF
jgi:hypothetical protein